MPVDTSKIEMSKAAELRLGNVSRMLAAWIRRGARQALSISPEGVLRAIARMLARPRQLGLYPGWKFAIEEDDPTWDVSWRLALWREFKERGIQDPVRVRWIDGLVTDLVLGNDLSRCVYVGGKLEPNESAFSIHSSNPEARSWTLEPTKASIRSSPLGGSRPTVGCSRLNPVLANAFGSSATFGSMTYMTSMCLAKGWPRPRGMPCCISPIGSTPG